MNVKILVDMNLSPDWVPLLVANGCPAAHWPQVGDPRATDATIMNRASVSGYIVFTHDLDFGTVLAPTHASGPSVLQVRGRDVLPDRLGDLIVAALRQHEQDLIAGALVVVDEGRSRVRVLPI